MKKFLATLLMIVMTLSLIAPLNVFAAAQPAAPQVTADDVNNKVLGMKTTYEYSLDGAEGVMYQSSSFASVDLSGNHELFVRVAATRTTIAGKITALRFTENPAPAPSPVVQPAAPIVTGDDLKNTVSGMKSTYEYSINGAEGVMYNATSFAQVDLSGNVEFRVRVAATGSTPAGLITTLKFTTNPIIIAPVPVPTPVPAPTPAPVTQPAAPILIADDVKNTVSGMKTTYEYSINGAEGVMYNATTFAQVNLSGNVEFRVRVAATATTPAGLITTLKFTTNPVVTEPVPVPVPVPTPVPAPTPVQPAAPIVIADDVKNTVTGMKTTYEYSYNGGDGVMYNATTFAQLDFSGNVEFLVRVAATSTAPAGLITTLKFTANPAPAPAPLPTGNSIFSDNFEGSLSSRWTKEFPNSTYSGKVSSNYASAGTSSFRIELRKSDPNVNGSKRSELALLDLEGAAEQHTYNFDILLPNGGSEDYALDPRGSEIIAQWHNVPDSGEQWTTPPLALRTFNGRYVLERCWDDAAITTDDQMTNKGYRTKYDLGSYIADKGKFVTWSFKVKWGWLASQNPKIEVYKNGTKVLTVDGPNTTNDKKGNVLKLGVYKWDWAQSNNTSVLSTRVIYYDNIIIQ